MTVRHVPLLTAGCARAAALMAALLGLLPAGAIAQDEAARAAPSTSPSGVVRVTAGEHGDFSRVVLTLGAAIEHRAEPEPSGLRVLFPGARLEFDYRESELIRRARRVVAAQTGLADAGSSFRLRFDCTCIARTSAYDGKIVIDVLDAERGDPHRPGARSAADAPGQAALPPAGASAGSANGATPRPEFMRRVEGFADPPAPARREPPAPGSSFDPEQLRRMLAQAVEDGHLTARGSRCRHAGDARRPGPGPDTSGRQGPPAGAGRSRARDR